MSRRARKLRIFRAPKNLAEQTTYYARLEFKDAAEKSAIERLPLDTCCVPQPAGKNVLQFYATGSVIRALREAGRKIEVLADADAFGRSMQRLIGKGDRFKGGASGPEGVGTLIPG